MKNRLARVLLPLFFLAAISPAAIIDPTNTYQVTVTSGGGLVIDVSSDSRYWSHTYYPTEVELLLGSLPLDGPVAPIPGTSGVYLQGYLFAGDMESLDGSVSIPLFNPAAARLGLPTGDLLLTPGSVSGGTYSGPVDLLTAEVSLTPSEISAIFSQSEFVIDLQNIGAPVTFGYPGTPITQDFETALITNDGGSIGAHALSINALGAPEPGTVGFVIIGLTILGTRFARRRASR